MSDPSPPELPDPLQRALKSLEAGQAPTSHDPQEDVILKRLRGEGLLRPPASRRSPLVFAIAALLLLSIGVSLGRASVDAAPPQPTHILILRGLARESGRPADEARIRALYSQWARTEPGVVGGEELSEEAARLGVAATTSDSTGAGSAIGEGDVVGYFLVRASSTSDALRIARLCPHLRFGGSVELRQIVAR